MKMKTMASFIFFPRWNLRVQSEYILVENVEFKPVDSSLAELIHVKPNANVIFSHVKASGSYLNNSEKNRK